MPTRVDTTTRTLTNTGPKNRDQTSSRYRKFLRGELSEDNPRFISAAEIVDSFRIAHSEPLDSVAKELQELFPENRNISSRLKRIESIISKLKFQPTLSLERMQDIAGCRIVTDSMPSLQVARQEIYKHFQVIAESNYIETPKDSGYRGIHLIIQRTHFDRILPVEIQLRTSIMHQWAVLVEMMASEMNYDLKRGDGPISLLEALRLISLDLSLMESTEYSGTIPRRQSVEAFNTLQHFISQIERTGEDL